VGIILEDNLSHPFISLPKLFGEFDFIEISNLGFPFYCWLTLAMLWLFCVWFFAS
jgi:hypothetical protein